MNIEIAFKIVNILKLFLSFEVVCESSNLKIPASVSKLRCTAGFFRIVKTDSGY